MNSFLSYENLFGARRRSPSRKTKKDMLSKLKSLSKREGISLTQACKLMNKKKKKLTKSQKKLNEQKKRKLRKVMKLHHKEGMTLKQAWKTVNNKFGTVSPPVGMELNPLWHPKSRVTKFIPICLPGMIRSSISNKCIYEKTPKTIDPFPTLKRVPSGYYLNPETGRFKKIRDPVPEITRTRNLPPGYEINPETGRRRKMCNPGEYRDPVTKRCKKIKIPTGVPVGDLIDFSEFGKKRDYGGFKYGKKIHGRSTSAFGLQDHLMIDGVKLGISETQPYIYGTRLDGLGRGDYIGQRATGIKSTLGTKTVHGRVMDGVGYNGNWQYTDADGTPRGQVYTSPPYRTKIQEWNQNNFGKKCNCRDCKK